MRPGQNKRSRGRNGGGGGGGGGNLHHGNRPRMPHRVQTFDSNGPNVKIRGNAYQVFERYMSLAREAQSSGDRVAAENFYQHAEHYFRVMNADGFNQNQNQNRPPSTPSDIEMAAGEGEQPDDEPAQVQVQVHPAPPPPPPADEDQLPAFLTGRTE